MFKKAERKQAKLRLALTGPSGSGKTYSALQLAIGLGGRIAFIDTEHGSASLYSDVTDFDVMELSAPYSPERYIDAIDMAERAGYDTLIIDSYSHEWIGAGGCLEINDELARAKFKGNTWSAWNETTPRHRRLTDRILASRMHIICTMRSKTETVQGENKKVIKLGLKNEQREGTDYEFTVVLDISHDGHMAVASKDRTRIFSVPEVITPETGEKLLAWLNDGSDPRAKAESQMVDLVADIANAADIESLKAAYAVAHGVVREFPDLLEKVVSEKDKRKSALTQEQQQ